MRLWLVLSGIVTIVSEAAIFYPPFPSQGQFHEQPPTPPPVPTPPPHYNPYHGQHNLHASQNAHLSHIPHTSHNPHGSLLALIQMYLNQLRPPPPRYAPPMHVFLPHTPRPTETEGQSSANFGLPAQPEGGAVVDGSLAAGSPAENEGGTTTPPVGGLPGFSLGGLVVNGGAHDFPPLTPGSTGQIQRPRIYNLRNNVPNNPLPIGQIRNTFYERLCYQTRPTVMPIIQAFHPNIQHPIFPADTADPPACSCIPFNDCESAAHRFINQKTKDECGSTLTGFACCCEEPPVIGR